MIAEPDVIAIVFAPEGEVTIPVRNLLQIPATQRTDMQFIPSDHALLAAFVVRPIAHSLYLPFRRTYSHDRPS